MLRALVPAVALVASVAAVAACSKPQPPTLVPKKATVTGMSAAGIDMQLDLDATNPNSIPLVAQSVTAKVSFDKQYDMGTATIAKSFDIPAGKTTTLSVPMSIPWSNVAPLVALGASGKNVTYDVDGSVVIGGASLNVTLPFTATGTITHDQIVAATVRSIPSIPGLTAPAPH
jgi:LEA14-like dessication related protein